MNTEWFKSSRSGPNGNCVEVQVREDGDVWVRDSKQGESSPVLQFTPREWSAFIQGVELGEFGL